MTSSANHLLVAGNQHFLFVLYTKSATSTHTHVNFVMRVSEDKAGMMTEGPTKASAGSVNVLAAGWLLDDWGQIVSCVNYVLARIVVTKS